MRIPPFRLLHSMLLGLGRDDHPHYLTSSRHSAINHDGLVIDHDGLENVTADQHHAKSHAHSGSDGSGTVAHSAITGVTANQHHNEDHASRHAPAGADELTTFMRSSLTPTTWAGAGVAGARQFNTVFQPSSTRPTFVTYSVDIACVSPTLAQAGRVELQMGETNPPTTIRASFRLQTGTATIVADRQTLSAIVPTGWYVRLLTTEEGNAPTFTLLHHTETPL